MISVKKLKKVQVILVLSAMTAMAAQGQTFDTLVEFNGHSGEDP
jgi:hypothetical protein